MHENVSPRQLRLRTKPLSVALSPIEEQQVKRAAYLTGETVSAFIREAAVRAAKRVERQQPDGARALPQAA